MNDAVVVDANLALKWVLLEADSTLSMELLDKWTDERKEIIAPAGAFGERSPHFRTFFGTTQKFQPIELPNASSLIRFFLAAMLPSRGPI